MRKISHIAPIALALALAACGRGNTDNSPVGQADNGNVTPGDVATTESDNSTGVPRDAAPATYAPDNGSSATDNSTGATGNGTGG